MEQVDMDHRTDMNKETIRIRILNIPLDVDSSCLQDHLEDKFGRCELEKITGHRDKPSSAVVSLSTRDGVKKLFDGGYRYDIEGQHVDVLPEVFDSVTMTVSKQWIEMINKCGMDPRRLLTEACDKVTTVKLEQKDAVTFVISGCVDALALTMEKIHELDEIEINQRTCRHDGEQSEASKMPTASRAGNDQQPRERDRQGKKDSPAESRKNRRLKDPEAQKGMGQSAEGNKGAASDDGLQQQKNVPVRPRILKNPTNNSAKNGNTDGGDATHGQLAQASQVGYARSNSQQDNTTYEQSVEGQGEGQGRDSKRCLKHSLSLEDQSDPVTQADASDSIQSLPANARIVFLSSDKHRYITSYLKREFESVCKKCDTFNPSEDGDSATWSFTAKTEKRLHEIETEFSEIMSLVISAEVQITPNIDLDTVTAICSVNKMKKSVMIDVSEGRRICIILGNNKDEVRATLGWLTHELAQQVHLATAVPHTRSHSIRRLQD